MTRDEFEERLARKFVRCLRDGQSQSHLEDLAAAVTTTGRASVYEQAVRDARAFFAECGEWQYANTSALVFVLKGGEADAGSEPRDRRESSLPADVTTGSAEAQEGPEAGTTRSVAIPEPAGPDLEPERITLWRPKRPGSIWTEWRHGDTPEAGPYLVLEVVPAEAYDREVEDKRCLKAMYAALHEAYDEATSRAYNDEVLQERDKLRALVRWCAERVWEGDIHGGEMQDHLVDLGIFVRVPADEAYRDEWGEDWMYGLVWEHPDA